MFDARSVQLFIVNLAQVAGFAGLMTTCLLLLHLTERATGRYVAHRLGWRAILVTGWLGVPIHELAHLLVARLFGHRIVDWALLAPDPQSGTLGYVRHAHTKRNLWQSIGYFFIAIAPAVAGCLILLSLLRWMIPTTTWQQLLSWGAALGRQSSDPLLALQSLGQLETFTLSAIWQHRTPLLPLQLYLALCVAGHLAPSRADLRGAWRGLGATLVLAVLGAGICALTNVSCVALLALALPAAAVVLAVVLFQGLYVGLIAALSRPADTTARRG